MVAGSHEVSLDDEIGGKGNMHPFEIMRIEYFGPTICLKWNPDQEYLGVF